MWKDFCEYIINEICEDKITIAEIAIGKFEDIANELSKKDNIAIIKSDINPKNNTIIKDDITNPNLKIYENVELIYSIRPPGELQPHLINLAQKLNCQLIIKPLTNENLNTGKVKMKLKNYKKASFYVLR